MKARIITATLVLLLLTAGAGLASAGLAGSMEEAAALAETSGLPVLLEIGTSW